MSGRTISSGSSGTCSSKIVTRVTLSSAASSAARSPCWIDRAVVSLAEQAHRRVAVDRNDERCTERSRLREVGHMAAMQDVEDAVGEDDRPCESLQRVRRGPRVRRSCVRSAALAVSCRVTDRFRARQRVGQSLRRVEQAAEASPWPGPVRSQAAGTSRPSVPSSTRMRYTRGARGLEVRLAVAEQHRLAERDAMLARGVEQHAGRRLAAFAVPPVRAVRLGRVVGTVSRRPRAERPRPRTRRRIQSVNS